MKFVNVVLKSSVKVKPKGFDRLKFFKKGSHLLVSEEEYHRIASWCTIEEDKEEGETKVENKKYDGYKTKEKDVDDVKKKKSK